MNLGLISTLRTWPVESQQAARRNAMVAATECAARRAERLDVVAFLEAKAAPPLPIAEPRKHG